MLTLRVWPWRAAAVAVAFDIAFVVGWWTLVYTPTEPLIAVERLGAVTLADQPVRRLDRLAPDGRFALAETAAGIALLDTREALGDDPALDVARVGADLVPGDLEAAVWLPAQDAAALLTEDGALWRWPRSGAPHRVGATELPAWLDGAGAAHPAPELGSPHRYVHAFLARSDGDDAIEVVSRETGEVLHTHEHGDSITLLANRGDPSTLPYHTTGTSARMELTCHPDGSGCERRKLPISFSYQAVAFARSPGGTRAASCQGRVARFGEIGDGALGLELGRVPTPRDCLDVSWLDEERLWVSVVGAVQLVRARKVLRRPLARWLP